MKIIFAIIIYNKYYLREVTFDIIIIIITNIIIIYLFIIIIEIFDKCYLKLIYTS